ncbi:putative RNA methyltransferase [Arthrobacter sp. SA17]
MPSDAVHSLLCPVCRQALGYGTGELRTLRCPAGHSFDAARQGYFNFLVGKGTAFEADSADMVAARSDFLSHGHYDGLALAIADTAAPALAAANPAVLDAGTGTGHYLRAILDRFPAAAIGLDISKFALRRAARIKTRTPSTLSATCGNGFRWRIAQSMSSPSSSLHATPPSSPGSCVPVGDS